MMKKKKDLQCFQTMLRVPVEIQRIQSLEHQPEVRWCPGGGPRQIQGQGARSVHWVCSPQQKH